MASVPARPDPSSPADVSAASFKLARRGFDPGEVRDFLRLVADELARLQDHASKVEAELAELKQAPPVSLAELDDTALKALASDEASRLLATARETAAQMKTRAEESSARLLVEANEEAQRVRAEAEVEAGRRRQDAAAAAEDELQMAKQQGRDMVNEARAYRERVLTELSRRRELARKQIEQLIQSRERLMQSFERSRLIAVDVMAEMAPGLAGELVDLSPITGPVPVVKPPARPEPKREAKPEPAPQREPQPRAQPEPEPRTAAVDDLFARLRAQSKPAMQSEKPKPKQKPKPTPKKKSPQAKPIEQPDQLSVFQATAPEPVPAPAETLASSLAPVIAAGARNLKRVLADEQNDVMERLRARQPVRESAALLPALDVHIKRYADALAEALVDVDDATMQPAFEALAATIVAPLRERMETSISAADGSNAELVNLTRTVYREWKTQRIDDHLEHVVHLAFRRDAGAVLNAGTAR